MVSNQATTMRVSLIFAAMLMGCMSAQAAEPEPRYDGKLWLEMSWQERSNFVWGYGDCEVDILRNPPGPEARGLEREMFDYYYYNQKASRLAEPIRVVMKRLVAKHRGDPPAKKVAKEDEGEVWPEKHGFFDGDFWHQSSEGERLAFVRGQIQCFHHEPRSKRRFSRLPADYVREISKWYEANGPELNRDKEKIPEVLLRFEDRGNASKSSGVSKKSQP
jgi:hypothetical protein